MIFRKEGFTLLELLLAVTIFAVVAIALYSSFYAGVRILRRTEEIMRYHQELRMAMDEISLDLHNALRTEVEKESEITLEGSEEDEEPIYYFLGDAKSFNFITLKDSYENNRLTRQICNVKYSFKGGKGGKLLRSVKYQSTGFAKSKDEDEELLPGILEDIEVTYSYEGDDEESPPVWLNYWEQEERIPLGVKIKMRIKGMGRIRDLYKIVYIDVGALGTEDGSTSASILPKLSNKVGL